MAAGMTCPVHFVGNVVVQFTQCPYVVPSATFDGIVVNCTAAVCKLPPGYASADDISTCGGGFCSFDHIQDLTCAAALVAQSTQIDASNAVCSERGGVWANVTGVCVAEASVLQST